jgi:hypothetical protein
MAMWPSSSTFRDPPRRLYGLWLGLFLIADPNPFGCGAGAGAASCPNDLPPSCPSEVPSYQATVAPIINVRCGSCHSPGGQEASLPFQTYAQVYPQRSAILNQVYSCNMPLAPAPRPTEQERQSLLTWLVCGAPQN